MFCLACGRFEAGGGALCRSCRGAVRAGPQWVTGSGLRVVAAAVHHDTTRRLVHRLKYDALPGVAGLLAELMEPHVPPTATALVPVPRAVIRRWRHGVDPARELSAALSRLTALPVVGALSPGVWWPHHAGRGDRPRAPARFVARGRPERSWVLVDDVSTSGATLEAAAGALDGMPDLGLVATAPSRVHREGASTGLPVARRLRGGSTIDPDGSVS